MNNYATLGNPSVPTMSMSGSVSAAARGSLDDPVEVPIDRIVAIAAGTERLGRAGRRIGQRWSSSASTPRNS